MKRGDVDLHIHIKLVYLQSIDMGEGKTFSLIFPINQPHISRLLAKIAVLKTGVVNLHIHTTFVYP